MIGWPAWLAWTPLTGWLWLSNRLVTWTGLFFLWKRWRTRRAAWFWLALLNVLSLSALSLVCLALRHR